MIRQALLAALASLAVAVAGPALAQDRTGPDAGQGGDRFHDAQGAGRQYGENRPGSDDRDRRDDRSGREGWAGHGMMMDHHGMGRGRWDDEGRDDAGRRSRGATFALSAGNMRLMIRCPSSEPVRACVDAAATLLDKARGAGAGSPVQDAPKP